MPTAEVLVDRLASLVRQRLPPGVTPAYFDGFLHRNRAALVSILEGQLAARVSRTGYLPGTRSSPALAPDLWSPAHLPHP